MYINKVARFAAVIMNKKYNKLPGYSMCLHLRKDRISHVAQGNRQPALNLCGLILVLIPSSRRAHLKKENKVQ